MSAKDGSVAVGNFMKAINSELGFVLVSQGISDHVSDQAKIIVIIGYQYYFELLSMARNKCQ